MALEIISKILAEKESKPNKFTVSMGKLIRQARTEAGLSQEELAKVLYCRRATISDIETGKSEVTSSQLPLLAASLDKPIGYFFPDWIKREVPPDEMTPEEKEMVIAMRLIWNARLQKAAIQQVKALALFDPTQEILEAAEFAQTRFDVNKEIGELLNRKKKR